MKRPTLAVFCLVALASGAETAEFTLSGQLVFRDGVRLYAVTGKPLNGRDGMYLQPPNTVPDVRTMSTPVEVPGCVSGKVSVVACTNGLRYSVSARCLSKKGERTEGCGIALMLPATAWTDSRWDTDDGRSGSITGDFRKVSFVTRRLNAFSVRSTDGRMLKLAFDRPVTLQARCRKLFFRPNCEIRFVPSGHGLFAKDAESALACVVETDGELVPRVAPYAEVRGGDEWTGFEYRKNIEPGSALDFSALGLNDAPAGKYGRVIAAGGHFVFEKRPDVRQRFYGVNFCMKVNCPEKAMTDELIPRLRRLGYNAIRIHHHEQPLVRDADGLRFQSRALDRFDYLVARAVENGFYLTTDLFVGRPVAWRALGIDREGCVPQATMKRLVLIGYRPAVDNLKAFVRAWLSHVNPYTGRDLAHEPALMSISLLNEAHLTKGWNEVRFLPSVEQEWKGWVSAHGDSEAAAHEFAVRREMQTERELKACLRELGYGGLVTGDNNAPYFVTGRAKLGDLYDFVDRHAYIDHPAFPCTSWRLPYQYENGNALLYPNGYMGVVGCARQFGTPFTVSEWNYSGSSPYRSMSGLMTGALAGVQDWSGLWRFAYSHQATELPDGCGKSQNFNLAGDALLQASDRLALLLFLRGDIALAAQGVALSLPPAEKVFSSGPVSIDSPWAPAYAWTRRIGTLPFGREEKEVRKCSLTDWCGTKSPFADEPTAGPVTVDRRRGGATVVTARTCGGFAEAGTPTCQAGALSFAVTGHRATVAASSLDGRPLEQSSHVLVFHLTDVADEGATYLGERRDFMLSRGAEGSRPMMHRGAAEIALSLASADRLSVWALDTAGRRVRSVPVRLDGGRLRFTAEVGEGASEMYYEIVHCP